MQDAHDMDLLRDYARQNSEAAFSELVHRHIGLVYSVALRRVGNPAHAGEITQAVFVILARKAASLRTGTVLEGWLYETARLSALNFLRAERRRRFREQEAYMQSIIETTGESVLWNQLAPRLEEAVSRLGKTDRDAVVLRFFKGKSIHEVAQTLAMNDAAAQRRILRALEKMRAYFSKHGIDSTTAAIAENISAHSVQAAPMALAKSVTVMALTKGATASTSTLTLIKGALKIMAWTKAKSAIVIGAAALFTIGATTTVVVAKKVRAYEVENYLAHWDKMNINTAPLPDMVMVRPTRYQNQGDYILIGGMGPDDRAMRRDANFEEILETAYGFSPELMVRKTRLPQGGFDMLLTTPNGSREMLRAEIKKQFGIVAHTETRDMQVLDMTLVNSNAPGIKLSAGGGPNIWSERDNIKLKGYTMTDITHVIGRYYERPVVDETGLTNKYDAEAKWDGNLRGKAFQQQISNIWRTQFGLALTPDTQPIQVLVVEKAQ
jgi:uncharacterized protein (TIGR03435 family)